MVVEIPEPLMPVSVDGELVGKAEKTIFCDIERPSIAPTLM
jgi:hypothetical protein